MVQVTTLESTNFASQSIQVLLTLQFCRHADDKSYETWLPPLRFQKMFWIASGPRRRPAADSKLSQRIPTRVMSIRTMGLGTPQRVKTRATLNGALRAGPLSGLQNWRATSMQHQLGSCRHVTSIHESWCLGQSQQSHHVMAVKILGANLVPYCD